MAADAGLTAPAFRRRLLPVQFGEGFLLAVVTGYVTVLCIVPLVRLCGEAGLVALSDSGGGLANLILSPATRTATWHTIEAGFGSMLLSVLIGTAAALLVGLTDIRFKPAAVCLLLLPMLIPAQISALAWLDLTGPASSVLGPLGLAPGPGTRTWLFSREGIVLLMGIEHSTIVFLALRAGLRSIPRELIEAARAGGAGSLRIVWAVILPLLRPSLFAGAALAFVAAIGNFGIPAMLGIPGRYTMLTVLIYQRLSGFGPRVLGEVAALSMILAIMAIAGLAAQAIALRRHRVSVGRDTVPPTPFPLGRWRPAAEAGLAITLLLIAVLPLMALIGTSFIKALGVPLSWDTATVAHYARALSQDAIRRAFVNSTSLAGAAALGSLAISLPFAYLVACRRRPLARLLSTVSDAPFALPGIVLSVAFILTFLKPLPLLGFSLYGTPWIILAAYLARFLALGLRPTLAGLEQLDPTLEEAGRVAGARSVTRLFRIVTPLAAPAAVAGALLIFMSAYNELTVSALLWSSGNETIGVMIFNLYDEGNATTAAAVSVLSIVATFLAAGIASLIARGLPEGVLPWQG